MNPIVSMMQQQNPMIAMFQPLISAMNQGMNPMAALGQTVANDGRMQQVMDVIRQNGGVPQAVYAEAKRKNVDPNDILNQARQMMQAFNVK